MATHSLAGSLAIFSKLHEFVQNSVLSPRSARFVISALGARLFSHFQQSSQICANSVFSPTSARFVTSHCVHHFLASCSKVQEFVQNSVFSPTSARFVIFLRLTHHLLAIFSKLPEFLQNSVFSPRSARFLIVALGTQLLRDFQQSAPVCTKQCFQPEVSTFCHLRTGCTTF